MSSSIPCAVLGCTKPATVTFNPKHYCSTHGLEKLQSEVTKATKPYLYPLSTSDTYR